LAFFPDRVPLRRHHQKLLSGTLSDGDLEEIIAIIITYVFPSTIHDSPIHVWVIPALGRRGW
jgi:hypothetical protein